MPRYALLILLPLFFITILTAQTESDTVDQSAFRKGRNLVGLTGSISSAYLSNANSTSQNNQIGNLYRFQPLKSNPTLLRFDFGVNQYGDTGIYFGVNEVF